MKLGEKNYLRWIIFIVIVNIVLILTEALAANATTPVSPPVKNPLSTMQLTLKKLTTEDGFVLKYINSGKDIYLPISYGWDVKSIHLHLNISHNLTENHIDSVTALIKDYPITSINMGDKADKNISWDIDIPAKYIKGPVVTVQIRRNWQDRGISCENQSVDWMSVDGDSTITYQYLPNKYQANLDVFPAPFINNLSIEKDKVMILMPNDVDNNELEAVYYVANSLYKRRTWRGIDLQGVMFDSATDDVKQNNNIVIVGVANKIQAMLDKAEIPLKINAQGLLVDNNNRPIAMDRGIVMEIASPWNEYHAVLVVTGNTIDAVRKAASVLRSPDFGKRVLFDKYALIDNPNVELEQSIDWQDTSLSELGYKDSVVYGAGVNAIKYELNLPANKMPDGMDVMLHYSVSPLLSGINNSYISLKVNNFPLTGEKININSANHLWAFHIDGKNLVPGKNSLTFAFDLKFHDIDCVPDDQSLAWGAIYANSKLHVDFSQKEVTYSFADLGDIEENINLFIPKENTIFTKKELVQLVISMATNIVNAKQFNIYYDSDDIEKLSKDSNVIYVGNMSDNSVLSSLRHNFPFCYVNKQVIVTPVIIPYLQKSEETPVGLLELIRSPYDRKQLFLLITADSVNGFDLVVDTFFNPDKNQYLRGNAAFVYSDGTFTSINANNLELKALNEKKMKSMSNAVWIGSMIVGVIFFGGLILIIVIRRIKRYFSRNSSHKD